MLLAVAVVAVAVVAAAVLQVAVVAVALRAGWPAAMLVPPQLHRVGRLWVWQLLQQQPQRRLRCRWWLPPRLATLPR